MNTDITTIKVATQTAHILRSRSFHILRRWTRRDFITLTIGWFCRCLWHIYNIAPVRFRYDMTRTVRSVLKMILVPRRHSIFCAASLRERAADTLSQTRVGELHRRECEVIPASRIRATPGRCRRGHIATKIVRTSSTAPARLRDRRDRRDLSLGPDWTVTLDRTFFNGEHRLWRLRIRSPARFRFVTRTSKAAYGVTTSLEVGVAGAMLICWPIQQDPVVLQEERGVGLRARLRSSWRAGETTTITATGSDHDPESQRDFAVDPAPAPRRRVVHRHRYADATPAEHRRSTTVRPVRALTMAEYRNQNDIDDAVGRCSLRESIRIML